SDGIERNEALAAAHPLRARTAVAAGADAAVLRIARLASRIAEILGVLWVWRDTGPVGITEGPHVDAARSARADGRATESPVNVRTVVDPTQHVARAQQAWTTCLLRADDAEHLLQER